MNGSVAIEGVGIVSPLGVELNDHLYRLEKGESVLGPPRCTMQAAASEWPVGEVDTLAWDGAEPKYVQLAVGAARQAIRHAKRHPDEIDLLVVGTAAGPRVRSDWEMSGLAPETPCLADEDHALSAGSAAIREALGLACRTLTLSTACSSGAATVAHAYHLLTTDRAKVALCIGIDELWLGSILAFGIIGALSAGPCQPYGASDGTSISEGAGALLLASIQTPRSADPYAFVTGVGQSTDAYHPSRPDPTAAVPFRAASGALSSVTHSRIDLISGHGTGTRANDRLEAKISTLLQASYGVPDNEGAPATFATKGLYGHSFGAAAAIELIELVAALRGDVCLARAAHLDQGNTTSPRTTGWTGLKNSYAMGGMNTSVVVSDRPSGRQTAEPALVELAAAGYATSDGVVAKSGSRRATWAATELEDLAERRRAARRTRWPTFDVLTCLTVAMASALLDVTTAGQDLDRCQHVGLLLATSRGPARSWRIATTALREGGSVGPDIIPNLSRHAAASNAAEHLRLQGPSTVFYVDPGDHMPILEVGAAMIESGSATELLVIEVDEDPIGHGLQPPRSAEQHVRGCLLSPKGAVPGSLGPYVSFSGMPFGHEIASTSIGEFLFGSGL